MPEGPGGRSYVFEPRDGTILLGLGAVQCGLLGAGLTIFVLAVATGFPAVLSVVALVASTAATFGRAGGRPVWAWLPLLVSWAAARAARRHRWCTPLPLLTPSGGRPAPMPPCLAGLDLAEIRPSESRAGPLGIVRDRAAGSLTALVRVEGAGFALAARVEQERLLAGWGDVLAELTDERGPISHITWSDFAAPSGLAAHRAWLESAPGVQAGSSPAVESYRDLLAGAGSTATAHDLTISLTASRARLGRRRAGTNPERALADAVVAAVESLARSLRAAGLHAVEPLTGAAIQRLLRLRIDPSMVRPRLVAGRLAERLGPVTAATAGPVTVACGWSHLRLDGAWHRTYWVESWPQRPQPPCWLDPFLSDGGITRTVTVVLEPVAAYASDRRIQADVVKLDSDAEIRAEKGRRTTGRHQRARAAVEDREAELVAGYREMGYVGLITVSAENEVQLTEACDAVEQLARRHHLALRSLDARQDLAWAAALPFGLAPRTVIGS